MSSQGGGKSPNRVKRALDLLRDALAWSTKHGRTAKAERIRKATEALDVGGSIPKMGRAAILRARAQSHDGPTQPHGLCLKMVVDAYQVRHGIPDAISSWNMAPDKHRTERPSQPPRGFPIYWSGGSEGHGHVAIAAGDGWCWSTDIKRSGRFDLVRVDRIRTQWGLNLLGWTGSINGTPVE